ncbi:RICIN domain-containing protein [Sphingomonas sp.]|uniref:RICIN domain-containing protein n=1 Tax=Sphingomonas sp. TaxID=28214 RepID=UPI001ED73A82|nr:RICIN domain-containing protein [Sphingomonas sp.]MBX3593813.1 ricin-type beta-trefoil lectin domain protein [Sphingomonas sp.]
MKRKIVIVGAATIACLSVALPLPAMAQVSVQVSGGMPAIASYYATGSCLDVGNGNVIMIAACNASRGAQGWRFVTGSYGMISLGNQTCLASNGQGQPLVAARCANTPNQRWALDYNGALRNEAGVCADIEGGNRSSGARVVGWSCHGGMNQKWYQATSGGRATYRISVATPLTSRGFEGRALISSSGPSPYNIVAGGAGNIVAGGAGNIVAGGAGNIVAGGAGNLIAQGIVAGGAGNLIANDGASMRVIAAGQFR